MKKITELEHTSTFDSEDSILGVFGEKVKLISKQSLANAISVLEFTRQEEFERIKSIAPTAEGNAIFEGMKADSYQKQSSVSGKNLWSHGDLRFTTVESKNINLASGTYTLSALVTTNSPDSTSDFVFYSTGEEVARISFVANTGERVSSTVTLGKNITNIRVYSMGEGTSSGYAATWSNIQIEAGSVVTEFEEYQPLSPSLESPSVIHSVGDMGWFDGELRQGHYYYSGGYYVANDKTSVCNVNPIPCKEGDLVSLEYSLDAQALWIYWYGENGFITRNTMTEGGLVAPTGTTYCNIMVYTGSEINPETAGHVCVTINGKYALIVGEVGKNLFKQDTCINAFVSSDLVQTVLEGYRLSEMYPVGTYTLSWGENTSKYIYVIYYNAAKKIIKRLVIAMNGITSTPVAQCDGASYIAVMYRWGGDDGTQFTYDIQLEEGSVATPYTKHKSKRTYIPITEPLRGIGDVKDEIVCQNGVYGVLRRLGSYTFDGSDDEEWGLDDTEYSYHNNEAKRRVVTQFLYATHPVKKASVDTDVIVSMSNLCSAVSSKQTWFAEVGASIDTGGRIHVYHDYYTLTTDRWKTFLASNNMVLDYELATPVFEPFEDQTPFYNFESYDGVTNVSIIGCHEELSPIITMRFPRNKDGAYIIAAYASAKLTESIVAELQAIISGLNNRATAIENSLVASTSQEE